MVFKRKNYSSAPKFTPPDRYFDLGNKKKVSVSLFNNSPLVNIREFYSASNGTDLPGKKGIALKPEQWLELLKYKDEINSELTSLGYKIEDEDSNDLGQLANKEKEKNVKKGKAEEDKNDIGSDIGREIEREMEKEEIKDKEEELKKAKNSQKGTVKEKETDKGTSKAKAKESKNENEDSMSDADDLDNELQTSKSDGAQISGVKRTGSDSKENSKYARYQ